MSKQLLRHCVLVLVIAFQALAGTLASAAPMMNPADTAHCESEAMVMSTVGMSTMADTEHSAHHADHDCDNGCCCPSVCSSAVAVLSQNVLVFHANTARQPITWLSHPITLSVNSLFRPPISA